VSVFVCLYFAGVSKTDISPSCLVENFTDVAVYTIPCAGKNVVLKYQGQGAVDLRRLTTTKVSTLIAKTDTDSDTETGTESMLPVVVVLLLRLVYELNHLIILFIFLFLHLT
jgi:hypothetical protein